MVNLNNEKGLTLVETIFALVLILILFGAFAGAMVVGLQSEVEVDKRLEASNLASGIIESLSDINLTDDEIGTYYIDVDNREINLISDEENGLKIDIDENLLLNSLNEDSILIISEYSGGLYEIKVNINWDDRGNTHELNIITLLAAD